MLNFGFVSKLLYLLFASVLLTSCQNQMMDHPDETRPEHHMDGGFKNLYVDHPDKNFFSFLFMKNFGGHEWADHEARSREVPVRQIDLALITKPSNDLQVSWLGHSTFLIQRNGINILTDPVFSERASPFTFAGPERYIPHVIDYKDLPKIDYVIISHSHYDHLDDTAVQQIANQAIYLVPLKLKPWFIYQGIDAARVVEHDWWQEIEYAEMTVKALPSQHWSARSMWDRHETLWASWLVNIGGFKIWFAGDTGYNDIQFKEIGQDAGGIDLALIPIGGYAPRDFMKTYHVNPKEAVNIHRDVLAKQSIGMHWGTFPLTAEGPIDPAKELARQIELNKLAQGEFTTMIVGETRVW